MELRPLYPEPFKKNLAYRFLRFWLTVEYRKVLKINEGLKPTSPKVSEDMRIATVRIFEIAKAHGLSWS